MVNREAVPGRVGGPGVRALPAAEGLARVRAEIEREKAGALAWAGERLHAALAALALLRAEVEAIESGRATPAGGLQPAEAARRRRVEYAAVRRTALQYHYHLIVQREAIGFRNQREVDRHYPTPGPLTQPPVAPTEVP
jgi:hypothetical protein